jgi:hypothetical protein
MDATAESSARLGALVEALLAAAPELAGLVRERLQSEFDGYRALPPDALEQTVRSQLERMIGAASAGRDAVTEADVAVLAEIGETRARDGIPVEVVLWAWRVGIQVVIDRARALGGDPAGVLDFIDSLLAWSDAALLAIAAAHRRTELELARRDQDHRADLVRAILFGTFAAAGAHGHLESYGIDPQREYVAIRARPAERALERALGFHDALQHRRGLSAVVDGDVAGFLRERPVGAPPGVVGVGPPRTVARLGESFRLATRALVTADAFGLTGAFDIAQLGLRPAVVADADVGDALHRRFIEPLEASRSTAELTASLRAYFDSGQHIERAAETLFVHPNTLRYRIGRFEQLTGANLRDPVVAFEVWWALERSSLRA